MITGVSQTGGVGGGGPPLGNFSHIIPFFSDNVPNTLGCCHGKINSRYVLPDMYCQFGGMSLGNPLGCCWQINIDWAKTLPLFVAELFDCHLSSSMSAHHGICWILSVDLGERQIGFAFHQEIFSKTSKLSKGGKSWQIGELLFRLFPVWLPGVPYWARARSPRGLIELMPSIRVGKVGMSRKRKLGRS